MKQEKKKPNDNLVIEDEESNLMVDKKKQKNLIEAGRPGGFLDFLPAEYLAREKMLKIITKTFRSYGFDFMETPIVEFDKVLKGEESDTGKQIFSITSSDTKGEALGLRFDLTVPFARVLAANPYNAEKKTGIKLPFKRMAYGPAFRGERPQKGRYRQFSQFDIDIAGSDLMLADAEILLLMSETMQNLGVSNFVIRVNNRKIFQGLADLVSGLVEGKKLKNENSEDRASNPVGTGVESLSESKELNGENREMNSSSQKTLNQQLEEINTEIIRIIDKVDKIGLTGIVDELKNKLKSEFNLTDEISQKIIQQVKTLLSLEGDNFSKLEKCAELFSFSKTAQEGVAELKEVFQLLKESNLEISKKIKIDFSIARGLDYYTGTVMETNLLDAPEYGSVFSGGRYNKLLERFTGQDLPVVGTSIGVDRLLTALQELNILDTSEQTTAEVMILRLADDQDSRYFQLAQTIRQAGMKTIISFLNDTTFKSQFNFALNSGVKFIAIMGADEIERGTVQLKNLITREQVEITQAEITEYFKEG
jgi:histidyl-tRNA synthetase